MAIIIDTIASASSRDYDWLKASIAKWNGNRSDLTSLIPDFVMLAEKRINGDLEAAAQEAAATITATAGANSISLPEDCGELIDLSLLGGGDIDYVPPKKFNAMHAQETSGMPVLFTTIGSNLYLGPLPDADYSLTLTYRQYVPALADSAGSNWLIQKHPEVYLAACMMESLFYTKNKDDMTMWEAKYQAAMTALNNTASFTGSMQVRSDARTV